MMSVAVYLGVAHVQTRAAASRGCDSGMKHARVAYGNQGESASDAGVASEEETQKRVSLRKGLGLAIDATTPEGALGKKASCSRALPEPRAPGVREHVQRVELGLGRVHLVGRGEGLVLQPVLLPLSLDVGNGCRPCACPRRRCRWRRPPQRARSCARHGQRSCRRSRRTRRRARRTSAPRKARATTPRRGAGPRR